MATPIVTVVKNVPAASVSTADVNVTATDPPPWPTTNVPNDTWRTPFTGGWTVPVRTSVAIVCDGVVVVEVFELLHAEVTRAIAARRCVTAILIRFIFSTGTFSKRNAAATTREVASERKWEMMRPLLLWPKEGSVVFVAKRGRTVLFRRRRLDRLNRRRHTWIPQIAYENAVIRLRGSRSV